MQNSLKSSYLDDVAKVVTIDMVKNCYLLQSLKVGTLITSSSISKLVRGRFCTDYTYV